MLNTVQDTYRNLRPSGVVDTVHVFAELGSMTVAVSVVLGHKQERVDHFMEKSLQKPNTHTHTHHNNQSRKIFLVTSF